MLKTTVCIFLWISSTHERKDSNYLSILSSSIGTICRYQCEGDKLFPLFALSEFSVYKKRILPYFISLYFLTPSFFPFWALWTDRRMDNILHPCPCSLHMFFFFSTERAAPGPPAGGATLLGWPNYGWGGWGWMADWTRSLYQQLSILSAALSVLLYQYHREYHTSLDRVLQQGVLGMGFRYIPQL